MASHHLHARAPHLGPRIPAAGSDITGRMDGIMNIAVPNRVVERQASATSDEASTTASCGPKETTGRCERGTTQAAFTLPIILGVVIPVVAAGILFLYLHRRHVRKQREEDANDRHASLDFGLGDVPQPGRTKRPPGTPDTYGGEKNGKSRNQLSMDMGVNSPYILPSQLNNSHESLRSMSRNMLHEHEDPYRPVTQYYPSDGASMRSQPRVGGDNGSSIYTGSSKETPARLQEFSASTNLLSNAGGMPVSTPPTTGFTPPVRQGSLPPKSPAMASNPAISELSGSPPPPPYPVEPVQAHIDDSSARKFLPSNPRPGQNLTPAASVGDRESFTSNDGAGLRLSNNYLGAFINARGPSPTSDLPPSPAPERSLPITPSKRMSPPVTNSLPTNPRPARKESLAQPVAQQAETQNIADDESDYGNGFQITPPSPKNKAAEVVRGQRYSMDVPPEEFAQAGLGAPGFDPRRLSMGFRPLPPNAVTESDDPEIRANRIRSFYKEYFDDSKPAPQGQYYEDYDENYNGAEYGQEGNSHAMPYAEPMARRAMTPPPRGPPRFQGQGQPRGRMGSMGAMSTGGMSAGGMRGPPQMYPSGPYPQGPKAYSSASGRQGPPRKPMAPPQDLTTLPTPSKLRDEDFDMMNPMDFAPPKTYRDRVAGRSESPMGERRAYSPAVSPFVPTVSAFEELAPVPSPHVLRKSGTFTGLDFAPPKKFRDPDAMSDAGSIRSNRSGVSQMQIGAIRNGAYRVSRLPQDMVGTKDDLLNSLKPQWGMRPGNN